MFDAMINKQPVQNVTERRGDELIKSLLAYIAEYVSIFLIHETMT
jgi:hypothetical protein